MVQSVLPRTPPPPRCEYCGAGAVVSSRSGSLPQLRRTPSRDAALLHSRIQGPCHIGRELRATTQRAMIIEYASATIIVPSIAGSSAIGTTEQTGCSIHPSGQGALRWHLTTKAGRFLRGVHSSASRSTLGAPAAQRPERAAPRRLVPGAQSRCGRCRPRRGQRSRPRFARRSGVSRGPSQPVDDRAAPARRGSSAHGMGRALRSVSPLRRAGAHGSAVARGRERGPEAVYAMRAVVRGSLGRGLSQGLAWFSCPGRESNSHGVAPNGS